MTLKEVARLAGVSPSAVSRYLNGGPLSAEKGEAIRTVIEKTNYYPDQAAHTLRTGRVKQVGVIVPRIHSETVNQVIAGITEVLDRQGYLPVLGCTGQDSRRESRYLEMMRAFHVAGVILMAISVSEAAAYRACPVPLVITGQRLSGFHCVLHDDFGAMYALTERFLARGRRKLGYISVDGRDVAVGRERLRGAREALLHAGVDPESMPVVESGFDWSNGVEAMERLLALCPECEGVLCATDSIAQGAMLALRRAGRRVPQDVSIAGVGDDWASLISTPQLTTARLSQMECGREAASLLLRLLSEPDIPPRQVTLGYSIMERQSIAEAAP